MQIIQKNKTVAFWPGRPTFHEYSFSQSLVSNRWRVIQSLVQIQVGGTQSIRSLHSFKSGRRPMAFHTQPLDISIAVNPTAQNHPNILERVSEKL